MAATARRIRIRPVLVGAALTVPLVIAGCSSSGSGSGGAGDNGNSTPQEPAVPQLPLPPVLDQLTTP